MKGFGAGPEPTDHPGPYSDGGCVRVADRDERGPEADPLLVGFDRVQGFLRAGWLFIARLAERNPTAYFAGWSL